jgi:two-component system, OmpR family, response regulator
MSEITSPRSSSPSSAARILVVDDEPEIRSFISRALSDAGYAIDFACDGDSALRKALDESFHLIILDLVMADTDGRNVLAKLHEERPEQAVLVLSCLADVTTKVECLNLGARDYLTKPFSLDELLARVRVQVRGLLQPHEVLRAGHLVLDLGRLQADAGVGPVPLTRLEFLLLRELMEHQGMSVSKDELLATVWGIDFDPGSNVVDVCVRRLRSKLGFDLIKTVRGAGYQLAA